VRTWEWPYLLKEIARVLQPQGVIRVIEMELIGQTSSVTIRQICQLLACAFFHAGHYFEPEIHGLTVHLERLLRAQGYRDIQMRTAGEISRPGTSLGQDAFDYTIRAFPLTRPFVQKWCGGDPTEYDRLYQQLLTEMREDPNIYSQSSFLTVWGRKEK
jgi:ubiquinone/menaquinone biosynthesis C-methylase UbiE